jgi:hypothetical protein
MSAKHKVVKMVSNRNLTSRHKQQVKDMKEETQRLLEVANRRWKSTGPGTDCRCEISIGRSASRGHAGDSPPSFGAFFLLLQGTQQRQFYNCHYNN